MISYKSARSEIDRVTTATPAQRFSAALIADATEEARRGCLDSYTWLACCADKWLVAFIGPHDIDETVRALLATVPRPDDLSQPAPREPPELAAQDYQPEND